MLLRLGLIFLCMLVGVLRADNDVKGAPWLTGTLLSPFTTVVKAGDVVVQPFLYAINHTGYDSYSNSLISTPNLLNVTPQIILVTGLTEWMDFNITAQGIYQQAGEARTFYPGDTTFGFDFQLIDGENKTYPSLLLTLDEIAPTGNYQELSFDKNGADSTGRGSWTSLAGLTLYQLFSLKNNHFLSAALGVFYTISAPVNVKDLNAYGGALHTRGKVFPGNSFTTILSFEYTLTKNWVLALDNLYTYNDRTRFKGDSLIPVGGPRTNQLSFAPAIEYNFNENLGLIGGAWFSVWGSEISGFAGGVISLSYTYTS